MADPFVGEIRIFPFSYAPEGWFECNGQTLNVNAYQLLYAVIGNTYGGTAPTTFALPNLSQSVAAGTGQSTSGLSNYALGKTYGSAAVTLTQANLPAHSHNVSAKRSSQQPTDATQSPVGADLTYLLATPPGQLITAMPSFAATADTVMSPATLSQAGSGGPHENRQPFLAMRFCIACDGIYPQPAN